MVHTRDMSATAKTTGQTFAATIRRIHTIGPRTRSSRVSQPMIAESVQDAVAYGGYLPATNDALRPGFAAVLGYNKHILGMRVSPIKCMEVKQMTPWQFTAMLGDMIDSGVTNVYEAELYFSGHLAEHQQALAS